MAKDTLQFDYTKRMSFAEFIPIIDDIESYKVYVGVIFFKLKSRPEETYQVKIRRLINRVEKSTQILNSMAYLLNTHKIPIRATFHLNYIGEPRCGEIVSDYTVVTRKGVCFMFDCMDGSQYMNDLTWQLVMSLLTHERTCIEFKKILF